MWTSIRRATDCLVVSALCTAPAFAQQSETGARPASQKVDTSARQPRGQSQVRPKNTTQQQSNGPLQRTANKPVSDQSAGQVDQMIAGMLALCNEEEAAIGKFAAGHAQHEDVQKFANMMAKDHAMMAKQLQKWAPEATMMSSAERASESTKSSGTMPFDPLQAHQQIARRSVASAEKSLGTKTGADFDMAYVGSQCVMHQQMIDKASVLRQYASPDLQSAIDKGLESAESHLDQAHRLIETLASAEKSRK